MYGFLKFLVLKQLLNYIFNDPEANKIVQTNLGFPAFQEALNTLVSEGKVDKAQQDAAEISEKDSIIYSQAGNNTELETIRKDVLQEMIYGEMTPEEAAEDIIGQYTDTLEQLKNSK